MLRIGKLVLLLLLLWVLLLIRRIKHDLIILVSLQPRRCLALQLNMALLLEVINVLASV